MVIAGAFTAGVLILRAASLASPWLAVLANALGALALVLFIPAFATVGYNLAKAAACPYRFVLAVEGAWDVGCGGACLVAGALFAARTPTAAILCLALPALGLSALVARRYYASGAGSWGG